MLQAFIIYINKIHSESLISAAQSDQNMTSAQ